MQNIYDVIIIGGGPAGYTAALYGARAGLNTLVLEGMAVGGQMMLTDVIENYPGFKNGIEGYMLASNMQSEAERFGAKTLYKEVVEVNLLSEIKEVKTKKESFYSKTVIIASGAKNRKLDINNEDKFANKGVHYCSHCDGRFYKDKTVAVIGGGDTAVNDAIYLSKLCKKVYLIHRRDELRATKIYQNALLNLQNVEVVFNSRVDEILGDRNFEGVVVNNTVSQTKNKLNLDAIFVSIGRIPNTEFLQNQVALKNGFIVTDETLQTNINNVFAAGDVREKELRQVITAASDGALAIYHAEKCLH